GDHIGVFDPRREASLTHQPVAERRVPGQLGRDHLQRDVAVEGDLLGEVNDAHPAAPHDLQDPVPPDVPTDQVALQHVLPFRRFESEDGRIVLIGGWGGEGTVRLVDFDLSQEQREFRTAIREFAREVVAPRAAEMDERGELPMDIVKQMGELGLFGLPFPEEYGGQGSDFLTLCIAIEELARVDSSIAITLEAGVGLGANPIYRYGTEEQKQRWLVPMCRGEILGSFGLTEPGGGSDAETTLTTARLEGGEWVINGSKAFITNSGTEISKVC